MISEASNRARAIVEAALKRAPAERSHFVALCCGADNALRREVEALLADSDVSARTDVHSTREVSIAKWSDLILFEELGRGAFGVVYRAFDPALERPVALKLIDVPKGEPAIVRRLLHEGRLLARIKHPNIVTVFGAQHIEDKVGIWMELVDGRTLDDIVQNDGPMGAEEAAVVGIAVCGALNAVHASGLVHRDVKGRNVVREAGGRIVLMDFGAGSDRIAASRFELAGTPVYMAPEVLRGEPASPGSDMYSVGALLYFLTVGKYPVAGHTFVDLHAAHERGDRVPLAEARPDLPDWFVRIVETALAARPADRYRSAASLRRALADGLASTPAGGASFGRTIARGGRSPEQPIGRKSARSGDSARGRLARERRTRRAARGAAVLIGIAAVPLLGFIASMGLNSTLGRTGAFAKESLLDYFVWGLRALVAPAVYMIIAVIIAILLSLIVRAVLLVTPRGASVTSALRARTTRVLAGLGLTDANAQMQAIAAAGAVAIALVIIGFADLMDAAMSFIPEVDPQQLTLLGPEHAKTRSLYGMALDVILLCVGTAVYRLGRRQAGDEPALSPVSLVLSGFVMVVAVLLLVMPYRVFWHNEFERAAFENARCYVIGEREGHVLLYCPNAPPPRNRVAAAGDPRLSRHGIIENIFAAAAPAADKESR